MCREVGDGGHHFLWIHSPKLKKYIHVVCECVLSLVPEEKKPTE